MTEISTEADKLIGLYNEEKLKKISSAIIRAYKQNDSETLLLYASKLEIEAKEYREKPAGVFRKMMLFYHPDRRTILHKKIRQLAGEGKREHLEKLRKYIAGREPEPKLKAKPEVTVSREEYSVNPFQEDLRSEDFIYTHRDTTRTAVSETYEFIEAVRALMYGNLPGEFLPKDLYHLDGELNLSEEGICDLSGLEFCINVTELILSRNNISNLSDISGLTQLVSLDLSRNDISYVDDLSSLTSLINLDLSFNAIEDVSPLLSLGELKYLNLIGNPIKSARSLQLLRNRGVIVLYDF